MTPGRSCAECGMEIADGESITGCSLKNCPELQPFTPYDQAALDEASRELHMFFLREGSRYGTKACEEIGRVFMTAYQKAASSEKTTLATQGGNGTLATDAAVAPAVAAPYTATECEADLKAGLARIGHPDKNGPELEAEFAEWMRGKELYGYAAGLEAWKESRRRCLTASSARKESAYEKARRTRLTEDACKCGLMKVPVGIDGVSWYWQRHSREECTLELPNSLCSCGLLRSEHLKGHKGDAPTDGKGNNG